MTIGKFLRLGRRQLHTIISREIIKPSSPTPSHLHCYNLSELDRVNPNGYMPLIYFYPNNGNCSLTANEKANVLKKSLSQSLTRYYPFAGRLPTPTTPYVDCNDKGVVFLEARIDSPLDVFQNMTEGDETLEQLFADDMIFYNSPHSTDLVGVQLNHFLCGGVAVAISMSHAIADACTLASFVNHWASVARYGSTHHNEVLLLDPHIIHSTCNNFTHLEARDGNQVYRNHVTRKLMFPNSKLNDLKNKVVSENNPTRVEVLISLLYKTAVAAATKKSGCFKPSFLFIMANIRNKFVQKLPQASVGNLASTMMIRTTHTSETSLNMLVAEIKKEKLKLEGVQSVQHAAESLKLLLSKLGSEDLDNVANGSGSYWFSSLCGFPFNKADFGWGNPMATTPSIRSQDRTGFLLMDTVNGDGIEVLVKFEKEFVEIFENDKEMLSFCQPKT